MMVSALFRRRWLVLTLCATLGACASVPKPAAPLPPPAQESTAVLPPPAPESAPRAQPEPPSTATLPPAAQASYEIQDWAALPGWADDNPAEALRAFTLSCDALKSAADWAAACAGAAQIRTSDPLAARAFFESAFAPWLVRNADGSSLGLVTGYYEPLLHGSRTFSGRYRYAVYGVPPDLLTIDLAAANPALKGMRLRGRMQDGKVVAYYTRAEIEQGLAPLRGRELLWVDDAVELFFLQVQGSGRVRLPGGETIRMGYAEHNGLPYVSIGKILVERGELSADKASMQGIKQWAARNPARLDWLLQQNPAYVFFRELPDSAPGPVGAQGVPLTPGRSIAVDPLTTPLGAPVFLATTAPGSARALNRLVIAQDTGTAIKGPVRADFFWGFGDGAGEAAGRMRSNGRMWILYPRGVTPKS